MRTTVLDSEFAQVKLEQTKALAKVTNITVGMDGWSNLRKNSVYACNATTPGRDVHLIDFVDVSIEFHGGDFLADMY
jgi:hypothetical protein